MAHDETLVRMRKSSHPKVRERSFRKAHLLILRRSLRGKFITNQLSGVPGKGKDHANASEKLYGLPRQRLELDSLLRHQESQNSRINWQAKKIGFAPGLPGRGSAKNLKAKGSTIDTLSTWTAFLATLLD